MPGPGQYTSKIDPLIKSSPKFGFGTGNRDDSTEKLKKYVPGPGTYDSGNIIGKDGPSKSMGIKPSTSPIEKEHHFKPGPGAYEPNPSVFLKSTPQFSVGTA